MKKVLLGSAALLAMVALLGDAQAEPRMVLIEEFTNTS